MVEMQFVVVRSGLYITNGKSPRRTSWSEPNSSLALIFQYCTGKAKKPMPTGTDSIPIVSAFRKCPKVPE